MSDTIYDCDFTKYLPQPLTHDSKMTALAKAAADGLLTASGLVENVLIYCRIDDLPEELVDILAYDFHVDWYDYSLPIEAKRDLLKSSVMVHKKMGTKYSIEKALSALYPESEIEEWFQYEGEPGHFQVVCDVTSQRITASYADIVRAVKLYKRVSAHMDDVVYQSHIHCQISTHTDCFKYRVPATGRVKTGTHPQRNRRGINYGNNIVVGTQAAGFIFVSPAAGTVPERNIVFHNHTAEIDAETALGIFTFKNTASGRTKTGETPQRNYRGAATSTGVEMDSGAEKYGFTSPAAGTSPEISTTQKTQDGTVENTVEAAGFAYAAKYCGSGRKL